MVKLNQTLPVKLNQSGYNRWIFNLAVGFIDLIIRQICVICM